MVRLLSERNQGENMTYDQGWKEHQKEMTKGDGDEPQDWRSTAEMRKAGLCPKCGGVMRDSLHNINPKPKGVIGLALQDLVPCKICPVCKYEVLTV